MFSNFRQCYQVMKDHSKITKMHFWMIQKAKNEVFGHFLEFGLLDRLDIAYFDSTKCFPTFSNVTTSWRIIQRWQKCIFEWSKEPKRRFFGHHSWPSWPSWTWWRLEELDDLDYLDYLDDLDDRDDLNHLDFNYSIIQLLTLSPLPCNVTILNVSWG